ncbi:MAG: hypothetical protein R3F21_18135 [Myxococcota bacterium]
MDRTWLWTGVAWGVLAIGVGCVRSEETNARDAGASASPTEEVLGPAEVFVWDDQPIVFQPPDEGWAREKEQSGGLSGVRFVRTGSGGERIHVAEFRRLGERDQCRELIDLDENLDALTPREFATKILRARSSLSVSSDDTEAEGFEDAVDLLHDAELAYRANDFEAVRDRIRTALLYLERIRFRLEDVVEPALFTGDGWAQLGRISVSEPSEAEVAGEPALVLDYELVPHDRDVVIRGREFYVEFNNRLFVASFQGFEASLPLFESLVETLAFEEGSCAH